MLKHFIIWLIITVLSIVAMPWFVDGKTYIDRVRGEQEQLAAEVGHETANYIITRSSSIYTSLFVESGFQPWVFERYQIGEENNPDNLLQPTQIDKAGLAAKRYLAAFFASMYETVFRMTQLGYWAAFAAPFAFAAAWDGLMQRKIRIASSLYSSPAKYNAIWHILIALVACTTIMCNLPYHVDAITYPLIVAIASMTIRSLLANLQRSA